MPSFPAVRVDSDPPSCWPPPAAGRLLAFALALLAILGCGPSGRKEYPVSGAVSFNGEAVAKGTVRFVPTDPKLPTQDGRIEQGRYHARLVPGEKRVEIVAVRDHPTKREPSLTPGKTIPVEEYYLPAKFHAETVLSATIDGPRDDLDFLLND